VFFELAVDVVKIRIGFDGFPSAVDRVDQAFLFITGHLGCLLIAKVNFATAPLNFTDSCFGAADTCRDLALAMACFG
jgi:hypothetical protein